MAPFFSAYSYTYSNFSSNDGSIINIVVTGGTPNVLVNITGPNGYNQNYVAPFIPDQLNLEPGTYTMHVIDGVGEQGNDVIVEILEKPETVLTVNINDACNCPDCDCVVTVSSYIHNSDCFEYNLYDGTNPIPIATYAGCTNNEYHQFTGLCTGQYRVEAVELDAIRYTYTAGAGITEDVISSVNAISIVYLTEPCSLCYKATNCEDPEDTMLITLPANLPPLDLTVTYEFVEFPDQCWTVEQSDECGGDPSSEILLNTGFIDGANNLGIEDQPDFNWELIAGDAPGIPTPAIINNQTFPGYGSLFNALWITQIASPHFIGISNDAIYERTFVLPPAFVPSLVLDLLTDVRAVVKLNGFIIGDNSNPVTYPDPLGTPANFSTSNPIHFNPSPAVNTLTVTFTLGSSGQEINAFALSGMVTSAGSPLLSIPVTINEIFIDCADCLGICYELIDCEGLLSPIQTDTNLSAYVGQVITLVTCPDTCWSVFEMDACPVTPIGVYLDKTFTDCTTCLPSDPPPPPLEIKNRTVKPGYDTKGCSPAYVEKINCSWSEALFQQAASKRYGIEFCCSPDFNGLNIKKQLMDLKMITDPEACVSSSSLCCPPCNVTAELITFRAASCPQPVLISAILIPPPVIATKDCRSVEVTYIINDGSNPGILNYVACNGAEAIITLNDGDPPQIICMDVNQPFVNNANIMTNVIGTCS